MPIPKPDVKIGVERLWSSPEAMEKAYNKMGWERTIIFDWVEFDHILNAIKLVRYRARGKDFPCSCGGGGFGRFFERRVRPTGPIITCSICQRSTSNVTNYDRFDILNEKYISLDEALMELKNSEQMMPPKLKAELLRRQYTPKI